jgi:hypothetical protein
MLCGTDADNAAGGRVDIHPEYFLMPPGRIGKGPAVAFYRSDIVEAALVDNSPSALAADAAGGPSGFGIAVLAELKLEKYKIILVGRGRARGNQQWNRQNGSAYRVLQHGRYSSCRRRTKPENGEKVSRTPAVNRWMVNKGRTRLTPLPCLHSLFVQAAGRALQQ